MSNTTDILPQIQNTPVILLAAFIIFLKVFIYLFAEREHKQGEQQAEGEEEAGSPLSREPNVGPDPRSMGSWPEPKADA